MKRNSTKSMRKDILTVILGGGTGTRLYPLTRLRAKPAVPFGGKYRLIDVPVSNAINSGFRKIFVLTQFNSASLNRHVAQTYRFDRFSPGFIQILAAEQTEQSRDWYQGTADAVRKQLSHFDREWVEHVVILSGDHLYRMDYNQLLARHEASKADVTVSSISLARAAVSDFGVVGVDESGIAVDFQEKPGPSKEISNLCIPPKLSSEWGVSKDHFLSSMGIYIFRKDALKEGLALPDTFDFGKEILPWMVENRRVAVFNFDNYWQDIGSISMFFEANLALCEENPAYRCWDEKDPLFSANTVLPTTKIIESSVKECVIAEGCHIISASLEKCVIGLRATISMDTQVKETILMGADFYESSARKEQSINAGIPLMGIGRNCHLERVIIDKNARIGDNVVLKGAPGKPNSDGPGWALRDGIVVVEKNAIIPSNTSV
jgi:glucose-1-phosphate adenylyltransferase